MKNGKLLIGLMTAVFLLLAAGIGTLEPAPEPEEKVNMPLSVTVLLDGRQETLECWDSGAGAYTVFLPSGAKLADAVISPEQNTRILLDGVSMEGPLNCSGLQPDTPYRRRCRHRAYPDLPAVGPDSISASGCTIRQHGDYPRNQG